MPDPNEIARQIVPFLAPFLPYLLKAGEKAAEEAGRKLGAAAWEQAQALWARLRPKVEARPAAQEAVADVAAHPQDEDALAALRLQLRKLLEEDAALREEVARLWQEARAAGLTVAAVGPRSVAIGGDVSGSVIVTGDQNRVQTGASAAALRSPARKPPGIVMIPVESSMIDSVGYDEETRSLQVVFNTGRVYCYEDVPPEVFQGLLEAESKGRYMLAHIIDVYPYRRGPCRKRR